MGNTNQPNSPEQPTTADLTLDERIRALELQAEQQSTGDDAPATAAGNGPIQPAKLSAELERHRDQLRDYEKALVERIADVDDDRRATASRLQRAWQTQREEIDDRLRRQAGLMAGLLLVFAVLVTVALVLIYRQGTTEQPGVTAEIAELRQELNQIGGDARSSDRLEVELARLSNDMEEIASSLERQSADAVQADPADAVERTPREEGGARIAEEMLRIKAEQESLAKEIESRMAEEMRRLEGKQTGLMAQVESLRADLAAGKGASSSAAAEPNSRDLAAQEATQRGTPAAEAGTKDIDAVAQEGTLDTAGPGADADADALGSEETLVAGEGSYALQLIGFFGRDSLAAFASRDGLPAQVYYLRQTHKGRPWYAMIHSLHEDYDAAVEELSGLPADLVALSPWIRPVPAGTELRVLETGPGR